MHKGEERCCWSCCQPAVPVLYARVPPAIRAVDVGEDSLGYNWLLLLRNERWRRKAEWRRCKLLFDARDGNFNPIFILPVRVSFCLLFDSLLLLRVAHPVLYPAPVACPQAGQKQLRFCIKARYDTPNTLTLARRRCKWALLAAAGPSTAPLRTALTPAATRSSTPEVRRHRTREGERR